MDENRNIEVKEAFEQQEQQEQREQQERQEKIEQAPPSAKDVWHAKLRGEGTRQRSNPGQQQTYYSAEPAGIAYYSTASGGATAGGRKMKPWIIFVIIIGALGLLGLLFSLIGFGGDEDLDLSGAASVGEEHIGVLYIEGTIGSTDDQYSQQYVLDAIDGMMENDDNKGLMLYVNTPGGSVYESDEVYLKLEEYQEETGRPVYAYMASQATSGGYYISTGADKIVANRNCWTGSIGVTIGTLYDISELLDKYGIKTETIDSGANKSMGSSVEPLTAEQKKILQSLVDDAYEQFVGIVAEGRDLSMAYVKELADGRIYTANQALSNGLIDAVVDTYDDAVSDMMSEYSLYDCEVYEFRYEPEYDWLGSLIRSVDKLSEASSGQSDLNVLTELMEDNGQIELQYMCEVVK